MAKSNVLVRVEADTKNYDANIQKARKQLERFGEDNLSAGGMLKQLSGNLLGVAAKFTSFGAAASAAMKVVKDAFMFNEQVVDEWGRTVQAAESVYNGFLNALNTGDISGFLSNIDRIVSAARDAYDAIDTLGTYNAFNKVNIASARADLSGAIADYREGSGSKSGVQKASQELINQLQTRMWYEQDAYKKAVANVARQRGVNPADLMKVMTGKWGTFDELANMKMTGSRQELVGAGAFARMATVAAPANERERLAQVVQGIRDEKEIEALQSLGEAAKMTEIEINNQRKQISRILNGKGGGTSGGGGGKTTKQEVEAVTGSIDAQAKKVQELQKAWRAAATDSSREDYRKQIEEAQFALDKMMGKTSGIPGMNYGMGDLAGKGGSGLFQDPLFTQNTYDENNWMSKAIAHSQWKLDDKTIKAVGEEFSRVTQELSPKEMLAKTTQDIGNIASGLSGIASGLQQLGIEIPQGIQQAIGILQVISSTLAAIQTISTIKLWANGGVVHAESGNIVPGNNFSGDMVPSMLNSGELILNRAQQGNIASQLQNNQQSGPQLAHVSGEQIYIAMSNYLRRSGKGELVTWR